jgi:hypothetical protein
MGCGFYERVDKINKSDLKHHKISVHHFEVLWATKLEWFHPKTTNIPRFCNAQENDHKHYCHLGVDSSITN